MVKGQTAYHKSKFNFYLCKTAAMMTMLIIDGGGGGGDGSSGSD
jgi:hypothetical protein